MTPLISYVPDDTIEKDAQALLAEYARARGVSIEAPILIDDIIEKHLKIGIEFDDMHRRFGIPRPGLTLDPDILGAIYFDDRRIVIDESLDPDDNPAKEGRYRYTAAHEVGHWRLHRGLFAKDPAQTSLLNADAPPNVICRTSQAKVRIEVQADLYASCVLMPRKLVMATWDKAFPDRKPRVLRPVVPIDHSFVEFDREMREFPVEERGEINRSKLGWLLKKNANRIVGGFEFQHAEADGRTAWRVSAVKTPPLTPSPSYAPSVGKTVTGWRGRI